VNGTDDVVWYLRIDEQDLGSILVLTVQGRVFSATVSDFRTRLAGLVARHPRALIVDFSGVDYINSQGLRVLERAAESAQASGCQFVLCELRPPVRTAFELAGSATRLAIESSREAALRRLGAT
jgi:anti-sigma B factor antagonist